MKENRKTETVAHPKTEVALLFENLSGMLQTYLKLMELELRYRVGEGISVLVIVLLGLLFSGLFFLFFSFMLAYWLAWVFEWPTFTGFLIVAVLNLVLLAVVFLMRNFVRKKLQSAIDQLTE